ncbi:hypothetical protein AVEN_49195-1 [Araneus ventricosus]|uniref:Uncharacterized protein n=1 Tax=Araneus ventricosus TaxID=182803 RepID=A0A4Y2USS1_ARAVE|nr:hypothetical protein AVEN_28846-1 [Araneus ventricosus]GBO15154.1 hypothetical protein AVEN_49195-1 [Araneus ventricosus]
MGWLVAARTGVLTLATTFWTILATWRKLDDSRKCVPFLDISIRKENRLEYTRKLHVTSCLSGRVYNGRSWIREQCVLIHWNDFGDSHAVRTRKPVS